jgi:hypothetical protein
MVLKDEAGTREARKLLGISGTEFRFGKQLCSGIASGSEVMNQVREILTLVMEVLLSVRN